VSVVVSRLLVGRSKSRLVRFLSLLKNLQTSKSDPAHYSVGIGPSFFRDRSAGDVKFRVYVVLLHHTPPCCGQREFLQFLYL
jgi:hypothetical protein